MRRPKISGAEYARRRRKVRSHMGDRGIAIVRGAQTKIRNRDTTFPFRQDSDLHYLTGFSEPDAVLVLMTIDGKPESILFCQERDPKRELWDGAVLGVEKAPDALGVDTAYPITDLPDILPNLLDGPERVFYTLGRDRDFDRELLAWIERLRQQKNRGARPPEAFLGLDHLLHDQRLYKSRGERAMMRHAARIGISAHRAMVARCAPDAFEYQLEASYWQVIREHNALAPYEPIIAGGSNACTLHYVANDGPLRAGDLVLIDAGAEVDCYASDITRTFPVSGQFTGEQAAIYDIVLAAEQAAIASARIGASWLSPHQTAARVITEGLVDLGLLSGDVDELVETEGFKPFFMHKTGHWLGLDVHDVGDYEIGGQPRVLEKHMAMTVEPGIYIRAAADIDPRWHNIGVRIEDDIVITDDAPEVLTAALPTARDDLEAVLAA